jgi:hypothetical protein
MLTKERWYLIFKHNRILGEPRIAMDEVRGESHAVSYVERLVGCPL